VDGDCVGARLCIADVSLLDEKTRSQGAAVACKPSLS